MTCPTMVTAGDYVLVAHAIGDTILQAKRGAYSVLKQLTLPNSPMYRTDIGDRLKKQLPLLQAMGYATGLEWAKA
jgi:phosphoribosylamine-glycine ligase